MAYDPSQPYVQVTLGPLRPRRDRPLDQVARPRQCGLCADLALLQPLDDR